MLPNEVFALECIARYAKEGLVVDSRNGQFAHCPEPKPKGQKWRLAGDLGYWLTFEDHQKQGLLQSVDFERRCFFTQDVSRWLNTKPPGYEELNVIFKNYISGRHNPQFNVPRTKDQNKAISGEKNPNYGRTGALHPDSKAIIVIEPDGTKLYFGSGHEAARELGMNQPSLSKYLDSGHVLTRGPRKGYQFFYAVKE